METDDGYVLTLHRIPNFNKTVVFLQHGLISSSGDWVLAGPGRSLAYILFDSGYDIWMGNARGNTYSRKHKKISPNSQSFWNFDWHEIALHDLPAMINLVLKRTGKEEVDYIGHSQGTTILLVLTSKVPKFGRKIKSAHLLAPVAYMSNAKAPLAPLGASLFGKPTPLMETFGNTEILSNSRGMELLGLYLCNDRVALDACASGWFLIGGYNEPNLNRTLLSEVLAITPAGSSLRQVLHFLQEYLSGKFREWDHGPAKNMEVYGSKNPPDYPVGNIKVPIYLYYSKNDFLSSDLDVERLYNEMHLEIAKEKYLVPDLKFSHIDYLYGLNSKEVLYDRIVFNLKKR